MADYQYTRALVSGGWNINNSALTDSQGTIPLARVVSEQFPSNGNVGLVANGTNVTISIAIALSGAEETTLDSIVANYKNGILP